MGLFKKIIAYTFLPLALIANQNIDYLVATNKLEKAIDSYLQNLEKTKVHNCNALKSIAHRLLQEGANSTEIHEKILTIYALRLASKVDDPSLISRLAETQNPAVQIACLHLLDHLADDRLNDLYKYSLNSSFLQVRFEAIIHLVMRNGPGSFGTLSSLMNLIPPIYHPSLVELFAIINSDAAKQKLRSFLSSKNPAMRLAAIKAITNHNLSEYTEDIRKFISHTDPKIKEAALHFAQNQHDLHALGLIKLALNSPYKQVQIAALKAKNAFGSANNIEPLIDLAQKKELYAIGSLQESPRAQKTLKNLLGDKDQNVRFNAALNLLKQRDSSCKEVVKEILKIDPNYQAITPEHSPGLSLTCIKSKPLAAIANDGQKNFFKMQTQNLLESVLTQTMLLNEESFLEIMTSIFDKRQLHLIPLAIKLLENKSSDKIETFLKQQANSLAAPLIRSYAQLSLYKKNKTYLSKKQLHSLIESLKYIKIIELDENQGLAVNPKTNSTHFDLSVQEKSSLFLQALEVLLQEHDSDALTCLIKVFKTGLKQNRYILAGLIIKCLD